MPAFREIEIPFDGFYESQWSHQIDWSQEQWAEYEADEREDGERARPEGERLSVDSLVGLLFRFTDYKATYAELTRDYVGALDYLAASELDCWKWGEGREWRDGEFRTIPVRVYSLGLEFEALDSPREYNFATDRIFAKIRLGMVRRLFAISAREGHATLSALIEDRFTSRSGFASYYPNALDDWLAKPLRDWDHNELGTLLRAVLQAAGADEDRIRRETFDLVFNGNGDIWENHVDWAGFEAACEAEREKRRAHA